MSTIHHSLSRDPITWLCMHPQFSPKDQNKFSNKQQPYVHTLHTVQTQFFYRSLRLWSVCYFLFSQLLILFVFFLLQNPGSTWTKEDEFPSFARLTDRCKDPPPEHPDYITLDSDSEEPSITPGVPAAAVVKQEVEGDDSRDAPSSDADPGTLSSPFFFFFFFSDPHFQFPLTLRKPVAPTRHRTPLRKVSLRFKFTSNIQFKWGCPHFLHKTQRSKSTWLHISSTVNS